MLLNESMCWMGAWITHPTQDLGLMSGSGYSLQHDAQCRPWQAEGFPQVIQFLSATTENHIEIPTLTTLKANSTWSQLILALEK